MRLLLQEKDQYREQVRQLTEQSDRLELLLLRSQGAELQLRARLRKFTFDGQQVRRGRKRKRRCEPEEMMMMIICLRSVRGAAGRRGRSQLRTQPKVRLLSR